MKKKIIVILLCITCVGLLLAGCAGSHKITVTGDKDLIVKCPSRAKTGEVVTVETVCVTDAAFYLNVSGVEVKMLTEGLYEFTMPDFDVEVSGYVSTAGFPGA